MTDRPTRSLELEQTLDATPEEVWEALTTDEGLRRWFPLDARVEPGEGGSLWLSWGPGCEGEAPIHIWEPGRRFGWTEDHATDPEGRAIKVAVDFYIEGRGGSTVVRLVQSGFSAGADWDEMFDAVKDGWTYFLFNLRFYIQHHRGTARTLVWKRAPTELSRNDVWERLASASLITAGDSGAAADGSSTDSSNVTRRIELDRELPVEVVSARPGRHFFAVLPELDDSVFFVEIEGRHVGFWLSTYGMSAEAVASLQSALDMKVDQALASA